MTIELIADHDDWLIVNKPAGISMQMEQGEPSATSLQQQVEAQFNIPKAYPVHRLDKVTSGLVIFAKSVAAAAAFGELFTSKAIEKYYVALASGKPKKKQGWIKGDMEKGRNGSWLLQRSMNNPALTYFQSVAIDTDSFIANRLYLLQPKTGKTHQLRVAMKSLGTAILGDQRYKGESAERCYLHAFHLQFIWQGKSFRYTALPYQGHWPELNEVELLERFFSAQ
jgi:tRNA pseudouridine32 synthase/23S rRNA pseudouridine746 synthase